MFPTPRSVTAALATLIILQLIMVTALYAGIPPHPPTSTPLFGMAPFLAAALAAATAALILDVGTGSGRAFSGLAALLALASYGPQKYLDAQFPLIWPAVLAAQLAVLVILLDLVAAFRARPAH